MVRWISLCSWCREPHLTSVGCLLLLLKKLRVCLCILVLLGSCHQGGWRNALRLSRWCSALGTAWLQSCCLIKQRHKSIPWEQQCAGSQGFPVMAKSGFFFHVFQSTSKTIYTTGLVCSALPSAWTKGHQQAVKKNEVCAWIGTYEFGIYDYCGVFFTHLSPNIHNSLFPEKICSAQSL